MGVEGLVVREQKVMKRIAAWGPLASRELLILLYWWRRGKNLFP